MLYLFLGGGNILSSKQNIVVVGGANIDIKGYSRNYILHSSSPGWVKQSPGGVGRNIAENLALLKQNVILLTVLSDDSYGETLIKSVQNSGVNTDHIKIIDKENYKTGIYLAHLDENGDLIGAVNDMRILKEIDEEYLTEKLKVIKESSLLVLDTNLEKDIIDLLLKTADENKTRTLVEAVSVEKSHKLKGKLDKIDYIRLNLDEAEEIFSLREENRRFSFSKRIKLFFQASEKFSQLPVMIVSAGDHGVYLFKREKNKLIKKHFRAEKLEKEKIVETTGAGDALSAAFAAGIASGFSEELSVELGIKAASLTIKSSLTCNPEISKLGRNFNEK